VLIHRKRQKFPLGEPTDRPGHRGMEEADDGSQHAVGRHGEAAMQPEHVPAEADHDGSIGMRDNPIDVTETQQSEPSREKIVH
jgi:hypothetical protein